MSLPKSVGNFEDVDAMRTQIREQAEHRQKHEYDDQYFDELMDKVVATSMVKVSSPCIGRRNDRFLAIL